jgi:hypothetical protein
LYSAFCVSFDNNRAVETQWNYPEKLQHNTIAYKQDEGIFAGRIGRQALGSVPETEKNRQTNRASFKVVGLRLAADQSQGAQTQLCKRIFNAITSQ